MKLVERDHRYDIENLEKSQQHQMMLYDAGDIDNKNDFQSYRLLAEGKENSNIDNHNIVGKRLKHEARIIYHIYRQYCQKHDISLNSDKLADFGGGGGFLANEMRDFFQDVYSYDVAEYAGVFGRNHFPKVHFITKALYPEDILDNSPFDMILAYEFYPFTRNRDFEYQKQYINMCLRNLQPEGILMIGLVKKKLNNILANIDEINNEFPDCKLKVINAPVTRIYGVIRNWHISCLISSFLYLLHIRDKHYFLVLKNLSNNPISIDESFHQGETK